MKSYNLICSCGSGEEVTGIDNHGQQYCDDCKYEAEARRYGESSHPRRTVKTRFFVTDRTGRKAPKMRAGHNGKW